MVDTVEQYARRHASPSFDISDYQISWAETVQLVSLRLRLFRQGEARPCLAAASAPVSDPQYGESVRVPG
jgi:hypothetical protein